MPSPCPSSALSTTSCQTFPLFSQLPPELRLKVWEYNLPGPRIVPVRCGARFPSPSAPTSSSSALSAATASNLDRPPGTAAPTPLPWCTSPAALPTNLHVCREARTEALRRYSRLFGLAGLPGHVYVDLACDVLYFGPRNGYMAAEAQMRTLLALADPAELMRVRRVAVHERLWGGSPETQSRGMARWTAAAAAAVVAATAVERAGGGGAPRRVSRPRRRPGAAMSVSPGMAEAPTPGPEAAGTAVMTATTTTTTTTTPPPPLPPPSLLAVHLAADVLDQLRMRLPGLREVLIVPGTEEDDGDEDECSDSKGEAAGEAGTPLCPRRATATAVVARVPLVAALAPPQPWLLSPSPLLASPQQQQQPQQQPQPQDQGPRTTTACPRWWSRSPVACSYHGTAPAPCHACHGHASRHGLAGHTGAATSSAGGPMTPMTAAHLPLHLSHAARVVQAALHRMGAGAPPDWVPPPWDVSLALLGSSNSGGGGSDAATGKQHLPKQQKQQQQQQQQQQKTHHQRPGTRKAKTKAKAKTRASCGSTATTTTATATQATTAVAAAPTMAGRHRSGCAQLALRTTAAGSARLRYRNR